jgi:L-ascorbate metabolism protein UlaG (beta-lactamase superfamily)
MKITKLAHSCLLIEEKELRILVDPGGTYFTLPDDLDRVDVILITHEHVDHYDLGVLEKVLGKSPSAKVFTNKGVGALLSKAGKSYSLLEGGSSVIEKNVTIEAFGNKHATILQALPTVDNTGYLIGNRVFLPGDALTVPPKPVEILGVPVAGPWLKLSEAVEYIRTVGPKLSFPIHEANLKEPMSTNVTKWPQRSVEAFGTSFLIIEPGKTAEV